MKPIVYVIFAVFAGLALLIALIGLPAAELLPAQVDPGPIAAGLSPVRSVHAMDMFEDVGKKLTEIFYNTSDLKIYVEGSPKSVGEAPGENKAYTMWAVFLSLAMLCAAIALNAVGRYDSEEKTVLPVKK